jgi:serine/threonine-protein kinase ULK/ATG1
VIKGDYGKECDIWSIGLILYEMIYGVTPWHSNNLVELMAKLESKVNIQFNLISILFIY